MICKAKRRILYTTALCVSALYTSACTHTEPGIEVRRVEVVKEVQKPCPGVVPERPEPLGPLVPGAANALAQVLAKLAEWSAPGKFGDQAMTYFEICGKVANEP